MMFSKKFSLKLRLDPCKDKCYSQSIFELITRLRYLVTVKSAGALSNFLNQVCRLRSKLSERILRMYRP